MINFENSMLNERPATKDFLLDITSVGQSRIGKLIEAGSRIVICQGLREGRRGVTTNEYWFSLLVDENV